MDFLAQIINWINVPVNAAGGILFAFVAVVPGWLSNTIISAVAGLGLMIIFKYTSNQDAIGKVRDDIKAHMLALKLFKDSMSVTLSAQGRVFRGAFLLLFHAVRPMLVMIVPVVLLMGQMGLWYQVRPLKPGEEAIVIMQLAGDIDAPWPEVNIKSMPAAEVTIEKTQVFSKRQLYWKIKALENSTEPVIFQVDTEQVTKELAIGDDYKRVSAKRPGWKFSDILLHPQEKPFASDSAVQSIEINYPDRLSKTSGTDWWLIYFFVISMIFALICKPFLNVRI